MPEVVDWKTFQAVYMKGIAYFTHIHENGEDKFFMSAMGENMYMRVEVDKTTMRRLLMELANHTSKFC